MIPKLLHTLRIVPSKAGHGIHTLEMSGKNEQSSTGEKSTSKGEEKNVSINDGEFICGFKGRLRTSDKLML